MRKVQLALAFVVVSVVIAGPSGCGAGSQSEAPTSTDGLPAAPYREVVLEADPEDETVTSGRMDVAVWVIEDRLDRIGIVGSEVWREGQRQICVRLPGDEDRTEVLEIIETAGVLLFFPVCDFGQSYDSEAEALAAAGVPTVNDLPFEKELVCWPAGQSTANPFDQYYIAETEPPLDGSMLMDVGYDSLGPNGSHRVTMQFDDDGAQALATTTRELALIGVATGASQQLAIVLDGEVISAPSVHDEISGGLVEIAGTFSLQEARNLALLLLTGALPVDLVVVSQRLVDSL